MSVRMNVSLFFDLPRAEKKMKKEEPKEEQKEEKKDEKKEEKMSRGKRKERKG